MYSVKDNRTSSARLPYSEIHGSKVAGTSPWLIAAYHVFHRLLTPEHPPYTLNNLTTILLKHCGFPRYFARYVHFTFDKFSKSESGDDRTRTCYLMLAKHLLYQVSYIPSKWA